MKTEIAGLRTEMKTEIAGLRTEMKNDLETAVGNLRTEMKTEIAGLRTEMSDQFASFRTEMNDQFAGFRTEVSDQFAKMERQRIADKEELREDLRRVVNSALEDARSWFRVIDDKYAPVPPRVDNLERMLDEHRVDYSLHKKPRRAAPKASGRSRSRPRR
jgi:hypothetical protein